LPAGHNFTYFQDDRRTVTVAKGKVAIPASNLSVMCDDDDGCQYRVLANTIETTNGATIVLTNPVPQVSGGPSDSGNWLSGTALVGAVPVEVSNPLAVVINGVQRSVTRTALGGNQGAPATNAQLAGTGIDRISLRHSRATANEAGNRRNETVDFLVWGAWIDAATAAVPSPIPERTWGGSISHGKPSRTAGPSATYVGEAQGFAKTTGGWTPWGGRVNLTANFSTQNVTGVIAQSDTIAAAPGGTPDTALVTGTDIHSIHLGKAPFGSELSGTVTIRGTGAAENETAGRTDARNAPSSGTWAGAFFGPTSADPTGIAGGFSAKRPASVSTTGTQSHYVGRWHGSVGSAEVTGAFGADVPDS